MLDCKGEGRKMKDFFGDDLISAHISQQSFDIWRKINDIRTINKQSPHMSLL